MRGRFRTNVQGKRNLRLGFLIAPGFGKAKVSGCSFQKGLIMKDDQYFLKEAVKVGLKGKEKGISPVVFGAVVVKDGKIIARDHSHTHQRHDPTAHAETSAIKKAGKKLSTHNLEGCILYGSHEPCLMCFSCAAWARMDRVVYATPASDLDDFTYEFQGVSLQSMAQKLARRPVKVELVRIQK